MAFAAGCCGICQEMPVPGLQSSPWFMATVPFALFRCLPG
uniref:Uncharacterized protein n=1 Tax=Arundo donax TaxID=35708 RepID=A0A0A9BLN9_ARUDO